ncbi:hypothetical protein BaRGS_00002372 [Batillaria attramentaria]|uniref:Endonuclease/exonuclease/phosphatase domain-containing protein n=1 Tax=Batillaria attramentaria TaxID=370345 RepID=A0ABD0M3A6_9CAEN
MLSLKTRPGYPSDKAQTAHSSLTFNHCNLSFLSYPISKALSTFSSTGNSRIMTCVVGMTQTSKPLNSLSLSRDSGGIVCLVRSTVVKYFKQLDINTNGNFLAFVVDKKLFGSTNDVLLICAYVPPEFSPFCGVFGVDNGVSLLEEYVTDCLQASGNLPILLCGDLNSRTSNICPLRFDDSHIYDAQHGTDDGTLKCNSEDVVLNSYGKMLLNMCSAFGLCIMNGMCNGDLQGLLHIHI